MVYIEVLEYLSKKGLYVKADIMPLFYKKSHDEAFELLKPIIEQSHIEYDFKFDEVRTSNDGSETPGNVIGLTCNITFSGMDFLIKHSLFERTKNSITQSVLDRYCDCSSTCCIDISIFIFELERY